MTELAMGDGLRRLDGPGCHVYIHMRTRTSETLVKCILTLLLYRLKWSKVRAVVKLFLLSDILAHSPLIRLHRVWAVKKKK